MILGLSRMVAIGTFVLGAGLLGACATNPYRPGGAMCDGIGACAEPAHKAAAGPHAMVTPYSEADFAPWSGSGPATLRGQAFLRTVGGDVKTCAGQDVYLVPGNSYDNEAMLSHGHAVLDPAAFHYWRKSICDAQGNFTFTGLPARRWYVGATVKWGVPHIESPGERPGPLTALILGIPPAPQVDQQGGELLTAVMLEPGENQILLTDRDLEK